MGIFTYDILFTGNEPIPIPFKRHTFSSLKQVTIHFLQMQSNPDWSIAVLSLTFDILKNSLFCVRQTNQS